MQLTEVLEFISTLPREQCREVAAAARARFKALREADPFVYVLQRTTTIPTGGASRKHNTFIYYSTWHEGSVIFAATDIKHFGGIEKGAEYAKDGGSGLAYWGTRQMAELYLAHHVEKAKKYNHLLQAEFCIREVWKDTGELCDFEKDLAKIEGVYRAT